MYSTGMIENSTRITKLSARKEMPIRGNGYDEYRNTSTVLYAHISHVLCMQNVEEPKLVSIKRIDDVLQDDYWPIMISRCSKTRLRYRISIS